MMMFCCIINLHLDKENQKAVIAAGGLPRLALLLKTRKESIRAQAVAALDHICEQGVNQWSLFY